MAAFENRSRRLAGVQYHPEVLHTPHGQQVLTRFLYEIAGLEAAPNWKRAEVLRNHLLGMFPNLPRDIPASRIKSWFGHRPSMPDGRPCIGHARASRDIVYAFGHGHVGLVGSARTADGGARTEASASLSGMLGGANVFAQANLADTGATEGIDRLAVDGDAARVHR